MNNYLFWIYFTNKSNCLEILKAQIRELEKFRRHERHDNVETIETDICGSHILSVVCAGVGRR